MPLKAILFDKDGTLIDFDATWGPAAYEVMRALARSDAGKLQALMTVSHYVEAERRFRPTSPLIAGSSAAYGPLWAQALGRAPSPDLYGEMDDLFRVWGLETLAPIGEPAAVAAGLKARGFKLGIARRRRSGSIPTSISWPATTLALGLSRTRAWCWPSRRPAIAARTRWP